MVHTEGEKKGTTKNSTSEICHNVRQTNTCKKPIKHANEANNQVSSLCYHYTRKEERNRHTHTSLLFRMQICIKLDPPAKLVSLHHPPPPPFFPANSYLSVPKLVPLSSYLLATRSPQSKP